MNIGLNQAIGGVIRQPITKSAGVGIREGGTFGSVFSKLTAQNDVAPVAVQKGNEGELPKETIMALFNATTTEELEVVLEELASHTPGAHQLEHTDIPGLIETIMPLLEQAGLKAEELQEASTITDVWSLLDIVDKVTPKIFEEIVHALEGKGSVPKDQVIELLAFLKTVAVQAANTDLTMKQEQQLFSLQGFLQAAGERFESTVQTQHPNRNHMLHLMERHQPIRVDVQTSANNGSLREEPKETLNHSVNPLTATRAEALPTELENKQNTRNEALIREMQNIFKRAKFGQTGGTNRLSIQLYPEHLGQVRIELLQVNGIMTARILASTALGKEMLESQLHQLRNAFVQQNLQVDRIDISQSLQDAPRNERDNAFNQHFRQQQEEFEEQDHEELEEQMSFQEYMIELEV